MSTRGLFGIQITPLPKGYRWRRLAAFVIDVAVVLVIVWVVYLITGTPDYPAVGVAMNAVQNAGDGADTQPLMNTFFALFDAAYVETLAIWAAFEAISQIVLRGATLGKLLLGLRVVPLNPARGYPLHCLLMTVRTLIKMLFIYLFQGLPFTISLLSILVTPKGQAGYEMFVKSYVEDVWPQHRTELAVVEDAERKRS